MRDRGGGHAASMAFETADRRGDPSCLLALIAAGADLKAKDASGLNVWQMARMGSPKLLDAMRAERDRFEIKAALGAGAERAVAPSKAPLRI